MTSSNAGSYDGAMPDWDAAFIWETEALRDIGRPRETGRHLRPGPAPAAETWVTLREASDATGIPVATLRSWIRKKRVPSTLEQTENGDRRLVLLDRVLARADELGREVEVVDLRSNGVSVERAAPSSETTPPPGTMVVPIEAWDKMLIQLGNLHEAGQQLAEARERAARAETEASFLRERLAELRAMPSAADSPTPETATPETAPVTPEVVGRPSFSAYLWRTTWSKLRRL